jgi:hypothetical protein
MSEKEQIDKCLLNFAEMSKRLEKIEYLLNKNLTKSKEFKTRSKITLNVRGKRFEVTIKKLNSFPTSIRIGKLKSYENLNSEELSKICDEYNLKKKEFYFDRDPDILSCILDLNETSKIHFNHDYCPIYLKRELNYWNIDEKYVDICCRFKIKNSEIKSDVFSVDEEFPLQDGKKLYDEYNKVFLGKLRLKIWKVMKNPDPRSSFIAFVN